MLVAAACATPAAPPAPWPLAQARALRGAGASTPIKHVVIIIQENRTFTNLFEGFAGADTQSYGYAHDGTKVTLKAVDFAHSQDMVHDFRNAVTAWDHGKMDRFDLTPTSGKGSAASTYPYAYVARSLIVPYWTLARQYVLADHTFPTQFGPSFTSHLTLIAGTTTIGSNVAEADYPPGMPWGCDQYTPSQSWTVNVRREVHLDGPQPCFTQFRTMADTLDAARVSWKYYAPAVNKGSGSLWSSFDAIKNVRFGPDWTRNVVSPQTQVLSDAAAGALPSVSWVIPDWADSDHPGAQSDTGPSWVASVVNAIGKSPQWKSTAIFIVWDDWGGWYDNLPPPQLDYRGLGLRVPMLVVSPYAKHGYVAHAQYEFGSILHFVEDTFGLPPLGAQTDGYTDQRAISPIDAFDFTQLPRGYVPIPAKYPSAYFLHRKPSLREPDEQ